MRAPYTTSEVARYYAERVPRLRQREATEWRATCPIHNGKDDNFSVNAETGAYFCHSQCNSGGSMIDLEMKLSRTDFKPAADEVDRIVGRSQDFTKRTLAKDRTVAEYSYTDENGKLLYQVVRKEPKRFVQKSPNGRGGWNYTTKGIRKVLFNLPEIIKAETVCIVEGEKDALALRAQGFAATCNPEGAGSWRASFNKTLSNKKVFIFPDNDGPGQQHAREVAQHLKGTASDVRIVPVPVGKDVSDWIAAGATREQIHAAMDSVAPVAEPTTKPTEATGLTLPVIWANNRQLREITDDCVAALLARNSPPDKFARYNRLVDLRRLDSDRLMLNQLNPDEARGHLTRCADFKAETRNGWKQVPPPMDAVKDLVTLPNLYERFPQIVGITEIPVLRPDGTVLDKPGYDAATGLYFAPGCLSIPSIPATPTREQIEQALQAIDSMIGEFPFAYELDSSGAFIADPDERRTEAVLSASKANALGCLLTSFVRPVVIGPTPLGLFDAPSPGTGKTLLSETVSILSTGRPATLFSAPDNEEEWRKQITSYLYENVPVVVLDNLVGPLQSAALCKALTAVLWGDRILGKTQSALLPVRCVWIATGNNIDVRGDLPRRCYWVRLDARIARPHMRSGFRHPNLREWVADNRGHLIAALLLLARTWFAAGQPKANTPVLGSYESWCATIGGILQHCGVHGFLANSVELHDRVDAASQEAELFLLSVYDTIADRRFTSSDISRLVRQAAPALQSALPATIGDAAQDETLFVRRVGKYLAEVADRRFGESQVYVTRAGVQHKVQVWRILNPTAVAPEVLQ